MSTMRFSCSHSPQHGWGPLTVFFVLSWIQMSGHVAGKAVPVLWSRNGLITCPETQSSMVVVEEGFYQHSTNACDDHCRPQMTGGQNVTCSFRNGTCVQGLSSRDLAAIYDLCWPSALPCNLTNANLSSSLVVRYSCMTERIFDPFNANFNWKDNSVLLSFHSASLRATSDVITECFVQSDSSSSSLNLHITGLNFPPLVDRGGGDDLSQSNDIVVQVDSESWHLPASLYPLWRIVSRTSINIEFHMKPSPQKRPVWLSIKEQNPDRRFEVICKSRPAPTTITTEQTTVQSTTMIETEKMFTLKELLMACGVTAVVFILLVAGICCVLYYLRKRRRWSDDRDSQHLVARFDNRSPDGAITISNGTEHPVCCSGEGDVRNNNSSCQLNEMRYSHLPLLRPGSPPSCSSFSSPCHFAPSTKECLPPGSVVSSPIYGNTEVNPDLSNTCSHDSAGYLLPAEVSSVLEKDTADLAKRPLPQSPASGQPSAASGQTWPQNYLSPCDGASSLPHRLPDDSSEYEEIPALGIPITKKY
ncbi:uncharacterized protein LOC112570832 [Pomacea canaliculata]|uniref:uncharacterized protein LOC112570832 n=1 Tax=Pomacea canaliculata TaxID=400727 RepID=UPI000D72F61E|nr:uncharacterized protein LOC112570832 [Pomacea canaliculata]